MAYDALGRLTEETSPLGTMRYGYDLAGRRIWISWPDWFWAAYDYDLANEVTSIRENGATSGPGVLMVYFYDDLGRRTSAWPGDGGVTWYAYDPAGRRSMMFSIRPASRCGSSRRVSRWWTTALSTRSIGTVIPLQPPSPVRFLVEQM